MAKENKTYVALDVMSMMNNMSPMPVTEEDFLKQVNASFRKKDIEEFAGTYDEFMMAIHFIPDDVDKSKGYVNLGYKGFLKSMRGRILILNAFRLWNLHKQVYKVDSDFYDELIKTESLKVNADIIKYLPNNTFFIDTTNVKSAETLEGIFVDCYRNEEEHLTDIVIIPIIKMGDDEVGVFGGELIILDEAGTVSIQVESSYLRDDVTTADTVYLVLQMMMYLASEKPDIVENETTKRTYRKPKNGNIKNRFSEIQAWDVGVRIGSMIRKSKSEDEKAKYAEMHTTNFSGFKRPHVRSAHWHRYKVGPGRTRTVVKWLPPMMIRQDLNNEIPVVIHEVK